jgi:archaellum biogenesis ATPase FlaH
VSDAYETKCVGFHGSNSSITFSVAPDRGLIVIPSPIPL